ncbi:hypothetical protein ONZ45_g13847 [Pleurotus djamor]|nr:hypothetical protein ONZ45_g13847 [Pleurotus djamor]
MPYQMYGQSKGTLVPGQTIAVGQFSVQVERYLSQGGFAHVYLVRTATPVYNTTHHVLKRIAVENEAMLAEVKKEVDVMRLLKGHPNIVHLIDAAWHRLSNGTYEVFILMEYCPGGGIIDMMNRRLRERLTEAEILQIFVDVCEGVAYMHSSRPPLLHRDLKVENILQSSPTSFKLCDFGSATTVSPRPPSTAEEVRALEADLNRHTTLQYRAPEMVDLYLRRPVDEKSDVWALGVLLYKLCYYTTPFEEHGPLAILNVQYRTPPYPVYSAQMNSLIASMLREHGVHRPTAFELLDQVHRLRGTKSQFKYNVPPSQPLSPRHSQFANTSSNKSSRHEAIGSQATQPATPSTGSTAKNAGVQAREAVLEAIAPMRRGRPTPSRDLADPTSSRPSSPSRPTQASTSETSTNRPVKNNWLDEGFDAEGEKAWKAISATKVREPAKSGGDAAWGVKPLQTQNKDKGDGFGDDFGQKLWNAFDPPPGKPKDPTGEVATSSTPTSIREPLLPARTAGLSASNTRSRLIPSKFKERDAFDGLGIQPSSKPEPTLGEARKLRTGLAILSHRPESRSPQPSSSRATYLSAQTQPMRGSASSPTPQSHTESVSPVAPPRPPSNQPLSLDLTVESRFPSLEELDASFATRPASKTPPVIGVRAGNQLTSQLQGLKLNHEVDLLKSSHLPFNHGGSRSAQVTGSAMRGQRNAIESRLDVDSKVSPGPHGRDLDTSTVKTAKSLEPQKSSQIPPLSNITGQRTNLSASLAQPGDYKASDTRSAIAPTKSGTKDWLTGSDTEQLQSTNATTKPTLRSSPTKKSPYADVGGSRFTKLNDIASSKSERNMPSAELPQSPISRSRLTSVTKPKGVPLRPANISTSDSKFQSSEPLSDNWSPLPISRKPGSLEKDIDIQSSADEDEGPEDAGGYNRQSDTSNATPKAKPKHKARQSSVHDLVDLWGGGIGDKDRKKDGNPPPNLDLSRLSPSKRTTVNLNSPTTTSFPRSRSPQPLSSDSRPEGKVPEANESRPQPSPTAPTPSPISSRSRPQSMFLFPSRSTGTPSAGLPALGSSSLSPPEDTPRRPARRTSISDMVQHYEAINKSTVVGLGPPPLADKPSDVRVPSRPLNVRKTSFDVPFNRPPVVSPTTYQPEPLRKVDTSLQLPTHSANSDTSQRRRSPISTSRTSPSGRRPEKDEPKHADDEVLSRFRKATSPEETESPANGSPPDQPYTGVGRLIDQWQRKTAENEGGPAGGPRRGGFVAKRTGVVGRQ